MNNIRRFTSILCLCYVAAACLEGTPAYGQSGNNDGAGRMDLSIHFGGMLALGSGSFKTTCDCLYDAGLTGLGGYGGAGLSYTFTDDIALLGRLTYQTLTATYTKESSSPRYTSDGSSTTVDFRRKAEMSLGSLAVSVLGRWRSGVGSLWFAGGPEVTILFPGSYKESEEIISGRGVYASTGTRSLTVADQPLDEQFTDIHTIGVSLCIGAGYDLMLDKRLTITPELMWAYPVTPFLPTANSLRHFPLRAGVAVAVMI